MVFNSWEFWLFFPAVYVVYLLLPRVMLQNLLLLSASYFFYASWNWRFLGLILASTAVDYLCGRGLDRFESPRTRKTLLLVSIVFNLSLLGIFKYFDFFASSLGQLLAGLGLTVSLPHLQLILPVGISFYTFQTLSYTIDVYRRELPSTRNLLNFALYVAFFPQLVAGPIERAKRFLPQIESARSLTPEALTIGFWLICWGMWKKIVVADNLGIIVDRTFDFSADATAWVSYLAMVGFTFQIYCDFSAYTDIARGVSKLMGFELMRNFNLPFLALNPADFWRRWHISLSTWLRDYLYIPLGGNRGGRRTHYRNLMITMVLGGLWHGAAWNFVIWGIFHGALLIVHRWYRTLRPATDTFRWWLASVQWAWMFHLTVFGFLIFRCNRRIEVDGVWSDASYQQFMEMLTAAANGWGWEAQTGAMLFEMGRVVLPLLVVEALQWKIGDEYFLARLPFWARTSGYAVLLLIFILLGVGTSDSFIYFQF